MHDKTMLMNTSFPIVLDSERGEETGGFTMMFLLIYFFFIFMEKLFLHKKIVRIDTCCAYVSGRE